jgi:gamma-glutamyl:cysteine ligase YbdK (ATP-grasp superfamily)
MGEEIAKTRFEPADFDAFQARLSEETDLAGRLFREKRFSEQGFTIGFEIEAWLLDHGYYPNSINQRFLETLAHEMVVPELSRFNIELNCTPRKLEGDVFSAVVDELSELWAHCNRVAHGLDANIVLIGTLPTIREDDLTLKNISALKRYCALNNEVLRRRNGRPLKVDIKGREHLFTEHGDVMLEAATTSFQVHLKTPAALAHRYFNASLMASGPIMAVSANAPFLFGKSLWDETRIPLFEQAVDIDAARSKNHRVTFGNDYLKSSMFEVIQENRDRYAALLPIVFDEPAERLRHLRLHNGTIWRWNRPLIGFEESGEPHLRIEHRILPAGPTFLDMMANAAFYIGLVHQLVETRFDESGELPFAEAKANFYAAARNGMEAELFWPPQGRLAAESLVLDELLPAAAEGLRKLGIGEDRTRFLDIVEARVRTRRSGAAWQRDALAARDGNFFELMAAYCERQRSGAPVYEWET